MNAESFTEYLKNPSRLYQMNYQELKSLALQYPYCQNLQWLLLYKSGIDHHRDFDANLEKTAAGSLDRTLLFRQMKEVIELEKPTEIFQLDEKLELQDLTKIQLQPKPIMRETPIEPPALPIVKELSKQTPQSDEWELEEEINLSRFELPTFAEATQTDDTEIEAEAIEPDFLDMPEAAIAAESDNEMPEATSETTENELVEINSETEEANTEEVIFDDNPKPSPLPKASFGSWTAYKAPSLEIKKSAKSRSDPKQNKNSISEILERSVTDTDEVTSETLAFILARQGQTDRAIKMYERLILLFPKKSAYFAAQIKKLKST